MIEQQHALYVRSAEPDHISTVDADGQHLQTEHDKGGDHNNDIIHFSWIQLNKKRGYEYKDTDILLDAGSTFSVFKNPDMVLNIRESQRTLKAYTNGGRHDSNKVADLPGFFTVWFNPSSMINILAWCNVTNKFRITADTSVGKYITVHLSPERRMIFEEVRSGLYLFCNKAHISSYNKISSYSYLILTKANMSNFTK